MTYRAFRSAPAARNGSRPAPTMPGVMRANSMSSTSTPVSASADLVALIILGARVSGQPGLVSVTRIRRSPTGLYPVRAATRTTSGGERAIIAKWARERTKLSSQISARTRAPARLLWRRRRFRGPRHARASQWPQIDPVGSAPLVTGFDCSQVKLTSIGNARNAWNRPQSAFRSFRNIVDIRWARFLRSAPPALTR
jgi:hypothetical protein